jgi:Na+-transporting NADH:ubiquinone oxidoreductase subunit A
VERIVSLSGAPVMQPRLLRTRLGASIHELVENEIDHETECRLISGSALHGHDAADQEAAFLGRYHQQVSVLSSQSQRQFLGWMAPHLKRTLGFDPLFSKLLPRERFNLTTLTNGEHRPLIPIGRYERYMPYKDIVVPLLFRALLCGDVDKAEALGALELEEEDLALCSFVCPSKIDFGTHLRKILMILEKETG